MRLGSVIRAVRLRRGMRQADIARGARVSTATVSRIERGHHDSIAVGTLLRVAAFLDIRIEFTPRWRGGELDRMLNSGHGTMHEAASRELAAAGWLLASEATFSIYGERGSIDILAMHTSTASLLVVELKTDIVAADALVAQVDRYRRLARLVAAERGWHPTSVSCWVAVRDTGSNHRRLAMHSAMLRNAFPDDGRRVRAWLRKPTGAISALSFLSDLHRGKASLAPSGVQRVRRRPSSVSFAAIHA